MYPIVQDFETDFCYQGVKTKIFYFSKVDDHLIMFFFYSYDILICFSLAEVPTC